MAKKPGAGRSAGKSVVGLGGGQRQLRQHVKKQANRSESSRQWLERQINDPYVAAAQRQGFRSRAAFKLMEIDDKYHVLKAGQTVIDLGAAPGGWSQVAADRVKSVDGVKGKRGQVVAIDYLGMEPIAGVEILELDFLDATAETQAEVTSHARSCRRRLVRYGGADCRSSRTDHLRIMGLAEVAAQFACDVLQPGGAFVCKVLQGGAERALLDILKRSFATVRHVKPPASRAESAELYVIATGFRGS